MDVKFSTHFDQQKEKFKSIKCIVACKRIGFNQIYVFDLFQKETNAEITNLQTEREANEFNDNKDVLSLIKRRQHLDQARGISKIHFRKNQYIITYEHKATEHQKLRFSRDGKQILYTDIHEKFFIQDLSGGQQIKRSLYQLNNKVVYFIKEDPDPEGEGFYLACSDEYDKYIRLEHTHRSNLDIKIIRLIEPGLLKTFDLSVRIKRKQNKQSGDALSPNETKNDIYMLQQRDHIFTMDQVTYYEIKNQLRTQHTMGAQDKIMPQSLRQSKILDARGARSGAQNVQEEFQQLNIRYRKAASGKVAAFSANWPYIAFSGMDDHLVIINAFEQEVVHRVQVFDEKQDIDIAQTYISDTNDLFCLVYEDQKYYLFMIDLDAANVKEADDEDIDLHKLYVIGEPILVYDEDQVAGYPIQKMHCRGSSRKEPVDSGDKLVGLFLHNYRIYIWIQNDDTVVGTKVILGLDQSMSSYSWQVHDDSTVYFMLDDRKMQSILKGDTQPETARSRAPDQADEDDSNFTQEITKININFSTIEVCPVYQEASMSDTIKTFGYDRVGQKIVMLLKADAHSQKLDGVVYTFQILDLATLKIELSIEIKNETLIGRLLSGLYTLLNGHLYYNNNVIKIRYDLVASANSYRYSEGDFFDYYFNIFELDDDIRILSSTPLDAIRSHRLAYISQDLSCKRPYTITYLPYLHERRIYLNEIRKNSDYFYTSIETESEDVKQHTLFLARECVRQERRGADAGAALRSQKTLQRGEDGKFKDSVKYRLLSDYYKGTRRQEKGISTFASIISMKLTKSRYKVYSQNGILINVVDFSDLTKKYGGPVAVSPDGLNYVFKWSEDEIDLRRQSTKDVEGVELIHDHFTLSVMSLSIFGVCHIKDINVYDAVKEYVRTAAGERGDKALRAFEKKHSWLFARDYDTVLEKCHLSIKISDRLDVCVQIKSKPASQGHVPPTYNQLQPHGSLDGATHQMLGLNIRQELMGGAPRRGQTLESRESEIMYYFESAAHQIDVQAVADENGLRCNHCTRERLERLCEEQAKNEHPQQQLYETRGSFQDDFEVNDKYLFLRKFTGVFYYDLKEPFEVDGEANCQRLDIAVDLRGGKYVKDIRTGRDPDTVAVILAQMGQDMDTILLWDMQDNNELQLFEVSQPYEILWDSRGLMYIVESDKVIISNQNCAIKAFSFQDLNLIQDQDFRYSQLLNKGLRFDGKNQNWMILREFLALPFSYMSFVIKDQIEKVGFQQYMNTSCFDSEAYNYIFNQSTSLLDDKFIISDYNQLCIILKKFAKQDTEMLEILNYAQMEPKLINKKQVMVKSRSILDSALEDGNNKIVSLLLSYMQKYERQNIKGIHNLFDQLSDYKAFEGFFKKLIIQTTLMQKKQIFRVKASYKSDIIAISESSSAYVDQQFYETQMGDISEKQSGKYLRQSVKINALQVGWIFDKENEENVGNFIDTILASDNLEYFNTQAMRLIICYLYKKFQSYYLMYVFPQFIAYGVCFFYLVFHNERNRNTFKMTSYNGKDYVEHTEISQTHRSVSMALQYIWLILSCFYMLFTCYKLFKMGPKQYFAHFFQWVDMPLNVIGFFIFHTEKQINNNFHMACPPIEGSIYEGQTLEKYSHNVQWQRIFYVVCAQLFILKLLYFLKIINRKFDSLIEIIVVILYDITYLMIILMLWVCISALSFYLIGQNQLDFDGLTEQNEIDSVAYGVTWIGALEYVFIMLLGESDTGGFSVGNSSQYWILVILFVGTTFFIMIHMLNMLIAVMGDTFSQRGEIAQELNYKNHLGFVRDQWYLIDSQYSYLRNVKYIIAACKEEIEAEPEHPVDQILLKRMASLTEQVHILLTGQGKQVNRIKKVEQTCENSSEMQQQIQELLQQSKFQQQAPLKIKFQQ